MKKQKLSLERLKVKSFKTGVLKTDAETLKGMGGPQGARRTVDGKHRECVSIIFHTDCCA